MIRSLYTATSGLISLENKQNVITNNLANANTLGFKSDTLGLKSFEEVYIQNKDSSRDGKTPNRIGSLSLGVAIDSIDTYFTQGNLNETNKNTDFAISGRGFFTIQRQTNQGNDVYYTRDGNFKVSTDGYLITKDGDNVLGRNRVTGNMEPIRINSNDFRIDENNNIFQNGISTQSLAMADFQDYSTLVKVGDNNYLGENPVYNSVVYVSQGYTEGSNVDVSSEMVNLMTNLRSFESNQTVIKVVDETLRQAATEIGRV